MAFYTPTKSPPACSAMTAGIVLIASLGLSGEIEGIVIAMRPILVQAKLGALAGYSLQVSIKTRNLMPATNLDPSLGNGPQVARFRTASSC